MPENKSRPSQDQPWENGWAPDTSRAPGTRRLWLAGALAVATIVACVTAIALNDKPADEKNTEAREGQTLSDGETAGGLISFATPSASGSTTPAGSKPGTSASASPTPSPSSSPRPQGSSSPHASAKPEASPTRKPSSPATSGYERSVQAVNYPDRYWHVSGGLVRLDAPGGSEFREDSTFTVVKGLYNSSCYTFKTHDGKYLRHRDFILRAERNDGSALFKQDATFCPGYSGYSGGVLLQSVNYPNYALRHENFQLRLDPYGYNTTNRQDFMFRLVDGLG
ncbi:AbfB domain-containing protein [Streptomyces sp. ME18-1-4]|uniref:AbfB domain-containing protein n=1 Tax=Streptomyces sp. ME18-1-4 TaxID=3028685 RepID=UPI0029B87EE1|nr:AbfB domain-containing protein [Streptomyces sp. ME18-1-4]MDX3241032.1 AbfB domain-containing protein [Streptomyces sp. ME18-1-4]